MRTFMMLPAARAGLLAWLLAALLAGLLAALLATPAPAAESVAHSAAAPATPRPAMPRPATTRPATTRPAASSPTATAPAPSHAAKPGAPLELVAEVLERAEPGGEFYLRAEVTPAISGELLLLEWRATPGIEFDSQATTQAMEVPAPAAGAALTLEARGRWSGELPGRVYLSAEWHGDGRRVPRSIAVSVIDAASEARLTRPATRDGVRAEQAEP